MNTKTDDGREPIRETPLPDQNRQEETPPVLEPFPEKQTPAPAEEPKPELTVEDILAQLKEGGVLSDPPQTPEAPAAPTEAEASPPPAEEPPRRTPSPPQRQTPGQKARDIVGGVLFYGVLLLILIGVFALRDESGAGAPVSFAGYTAQIVLTGSMEDVIPQGSLVVAKRVDPAALQIGDDIIYLSSQTSTITHRIVGIIEEYSDTGQRAFQTQGVMNERPDKTPVAAVNVVGKVVFHSLALGRIATFIRQNWPLLIFFAVLLLVLMKVLLRIRSGGADIDAAARGTPLDKTNKKELGGKQE